MKINMNQILGLEQVISGLVSEKMPIKLAYKLNKLVSAIQKEKEFYTQKMGALIETYGEKDENGNYVYTESGDGVVLKEATRAECESQLQELHRLDIDFPDINLTLDELENFNFTLFEMNALEPIIKD